MRELNRILSLVRVVTRLDAWRPVSESNAPISALQAHP